MHPAVSDVSNNNSNSRISGGSSRGSDDGSNNGSGNCDSNDRGVNDPSSIDSIDCTVSPHVGSTSQCLNDTRTKTVKR